jgi:hypothetical protein
MKRLFSRRTIVRLSLAAILIAGCAVAFSMTNNREESAPQKISLSYLARITDANAETHCDVAVPQVCSGDGAGCLYQAYFDNIGWLWVTSQYCKQ